MTKFIPDIKLWYCKADKKTGRPILVQDLDTGKISKTDEIVYNNVNIRMKFNNSTGKAKSSGATTILEIQRN